MHKGEKSLLEIMVGIDGEDALHREKLDAQRCRERGDKNQEERHLRRIDIILEILASNQHKKMQRKSINPNDVDLYGGISGLHLREFELFEGLRIDPVFSHVMSPYIVAFSKAEDGKPHPGPWKAASGGLGFDITAQISLAKDCKPTEFDRVNTLWWILSLLRIHHPIGVRIPVISDTSFFIAQSSTNEPTFWPVEVSPNMNIFDHGVSEIYTTQSMQWIKENFVAGAIMMNDDRFNLAYRALDTASHVPSSSAAMLLIWSSLEALFKLGKGKLTHRLSLAIATYIEDNPKNRDRTYQNISKLYSIRSQITHAAEMPEPCDVQQSFKFARTCFLRSIKNSQTPNFDTLLKKWKNRS